MTRSVAILVEQIYEDMELQYPRFRLLEAGFKVQVVGPKAGEVYKGKHGYPQKSDVAAADVHACDFSLILVPGGFAPDFMRRDEHMIRLVREAGEAGIPLAAICHGVWMFCSANILDGRKCTSFFAIAHDVANAGATWVDEECVVDGNLVTSRTPADLPSFMRSILEVLEAGQSSGAKGSAVAPAWVGDSLKQPVH
jgi:protease I